MIPPDSEVRAAAAPRAAMQQCFNCGVSVLPPPGYPQFRCGGCRAVNTTRLAPQPAPFYPPQPTALSQPPPQQQQRPPAPAPAAGGQPCAACTFQNAPGAALCAVCGQRLQLPRLPASPTAAAAASAMPWSCATCTLTNAAHLKKCSVCGYTRIDGSSSGGSGSSGGGGGTFAALSAAAAASPPPAQTPALASSPFASGSGSGGGGGGGGGALSPLSSTSRGSLDPRIVFQSQGDGASPREDERCRASYQALAREVQARGPYAQFSDTDFPTTPASLGGGAEVHITFAGHGRVGVPVLWRRPGSLADEAGVFQPGSPANPAAELAELVREAPLTAAAVTGSSGGAGERPYRHPTRAEVAFLAEQASLRAAGGGGGSARGGPPWVFRRDRYACADVVQGQLGTCWFVSALAVVAERESLVAALFAAEPLRDALASAGRPCDLRDLLRGPIPLHPLGLYAVRLCIDGLWRWLTVDDRIPADAYRGQPAYTSARGRQLWVALLEKAAAKACGSYAGLAAGTLAEGLRLLTGAPVASLHVATNETEAAQRARH